MSNLSIHQQDRVEQFIIATPEERQDIHARVSEGHKNTIDRGLKEVGFEAIEWFKRVFVDPERSRVHQDSLTVRDKIRKGSFHKSSRNHAERVTVMSKALSDPKMPFSIRMRDQVTDMICVIRSDIKVIENADEAAKAVRSKVNSVLNSLPESPEKEVLTKIAGSFFPEECDPAIATSAQELVQGDAKLTVRNGLCFLSPPEDESLTLFKKGPLQNAHSKRSIWDERGPVPLSYNLSPSEIARRKHKLPSIDVVSIDWDSFVNMILDTLTDEKKSRPDSWSYAHFIRQRMMVETGRREQRMLVGACLEFHKALIRVGNTLEPSLRRKVCHDIFTKVKKALREHRPEIDGRFLSFAAAASVSEPTILLNHAERVSTRKLSASMQDPTTLPTRAY